MAGIVVIVSVNLENDFRKVITRFTASFASVRYGQMMRSAGLNESELAKVYEKQPLMKSSLFVQSVTYFNVFIEDLALDIERMYLQEKFDAVVLDYCQILKIRNYHKLSKYEYLQEIMRGLNCIARKLDIVVVTAAQINKEAIKRVSKSKGQDTVEMFDIAESFGITKAVDSLITITKSSEDDARNRIRFKLAKNRDGAVNKVVSCETDFACCRIFAPDLITREIIGKEEDHPDKEGIESILR